MFLFGSAVFFFFNNENTATVQRWPSVTSSRPEFYGQSPYLNYGRLS